MNDILNNHCLIPWLSFAQCMTLITKHTDPVMQSEAMLMPISGL